MTASGGVLAEFTAVARNRNLRRLELAYGVAITSEWAFAVALGVFAYERGGAAAVGFLTPRVGVPRGPTGRAPDQQNHCHRTRLSLGPRPANGLASGIDGLGGTVVEPLRAPHRSAEPHG